VTKPHAFFVTIANTIAVAVTCVAVAVTCVAVAVTCVAVAVTDIVMAVISVASPTTVSTCNSATIVELGA